MQSATVGTNEKSFMQVKKREPENQPTKSLPLKTLRQWQFIMVTGIMCLITPSFSTSAQTGRQNDSIITEATALQIWKKQLWQAAKKQGISKRTFTKAINNTQPNYKLPRVRTKAEWAKLAQRSKIAKSTPIEKRPLPASCYRPRQKEFLFPTLYFPPKHISTLVRRGKAIRQKYKTTLTKIEQKYGVSMRAVLGIWGRETAYGQAKNKYNGIQTLLSLAYRGPKEKRASHQQNLLHALMFIDQGHISLKDYKTSFAGATGYPQFTPDVFAAYAVDFDGDGRKNIWTSVPDALASAANYLQGIGWQRGMHWGYEVTVPVGFNCAVEGPLGRKTITEWKKLGLRRQHSQAGKPQDFPDSNQLAQFVAPAGIYGPLFLVTENFEVFRRYNKADLYALFVGHLGDSIWCDKSRKQTSCNFIAPWPSKDNFNFTRKRICEMQIYLQKSKASQEQPDGLFGGKTRNGIGTYEQNIGKSPTCFPANALLNRMRNNHAN